jgi:hypothetical protein
MSQKVSFHILLIVSSESVRRRLTLTIVSTIKFSSWEDD